MIKVSKAVLSTYGAGVLELCQGLADYRSPNRGAAGKLARPTI
jgi:hypothetical protein